MDEIGSNTDGIIIPLKFKIEWTNVDFFFFLFQLAFEPFYTNDRWTQPR